VVVNGQSGEELIAMVKKAMEAKTLLVFLFHGVGGEHDLNVSLPAHRQLLQFLKQNQDRIWVATFLDIAQHIRSQQKAKAPAVQSASPR
jgi:peptidoglycan-N-acetylglucosamine deacetylase